MPREKDIVPGVPHFSPPKVYPPRFDLRRYRLVTDEERKQHERELALRRGDPVPPFRPKPDQKADRDADHQADSQKSGEKEQVEDRHPKLDFLDRIVLRHLMRLKPRQSHPA